eukprot:COSAG06_NODE_121_length_23085_cov_7.727791_8_plen_193_part_00
MRRCAVDSSRSLFRRQPRGNTAVLRGLLRAPVRTPRAPNPARAPTLTMVVFFLLLDTTPAKTGRGARLSRVQVCGGLCREEREERIQIGCCIAFYHTAVGRASAPAPCVIHGGLNQALTQTAISRFRPHELSSVHAIRQVLNCLSRTQQKRAQWVGAIFSLSLCLSSLRSSHTSTRSLTPRPLITYISPLIP